MDDPQDEDVIYVAWEDFSAILAHLYDICDLLQSALEDMRDAHPALVLVPRKPKEEGH